MQKISQFLAKYLWAVILITLALFAALVFYVAGLYQERQTDKAIRKTETQANSAVGESVNAQKRADNSSAERRTEDVIREKTITPKLEKARVNSNNSKIELERVTRTYNDEKRHPQNLNSSDADNCRKLVRLFPETEFADCR